ncbi:hypothetical protein ISN44_As05g038580, partial [Arabidopsis suecica]
MLQFYLFCNLKWECLIRWLKALTCINIGNMFYGLRSKTHCWRTFLKSMVI